jgi:hypothetical protein
VSPEILLIECQASIILCSISFHAVLDKKRKPFVKDKSFLCFLKFRRSVTLALLLYELNAEECRKEGARELKKNGGHKTFSRAQCQKKKR